jgi:hypothetical protein
MPTIRTLGHLSKRTTFTYTGSVREGVVLEFTGSHKISSEFFLALLNNFDGQTIPGGFSNVNPYPGGLGAWVVHNSRNISPPKLSSRHASFIAAILANEGYITSTLRGNAVILHFPKRPIKDKL